MTAAVGLALPGGLRWPALMSLLSSRRPRLREPAAAEEDAALVSRAARGDRGAFEQLHSRHVNEVWRGLTRLIGADPEREDLTQQIFMEVYHGLPRFRGDATFRTFLMKVVVNAAYDHLGRRRRRSHQQAAVEPDAVELLAAPDTPPDVLAERREIVALTWSALGRIKPKKRIAFTLRVVEEMSLEEIGNLVGASVATVAKRVRHAQIELHRMLERRLRERAACRPGETS